MARNLRSICEDNGAELQGMSIITNGTLLNKSCAKELSNVGITRAQISFDGLKHEEYKKRGIFQKDGELSPILKNILESRDYINIKIRININKENKDEAYEIHNALKKHNLQDNIYFARISNTDSFSNINIESNKNDGNTLSYSEFSKAEQELYWDKLTPNVLKNLVYRLNPRSRFCSATTDEFYVFDPRGNISRCWHSAGNHAEKVGTIYDEVETIHFSNIQEKWNSFSPFSSRKCISCKVLPLCMGGCPHSRVFGSIESPQCESIKSQIKQIVEVVGNALLLPSATN